MSTPEICYNFAIFEAIPMIVIQLGAGYRFIMDINKQINYCNKYKSEITYMLFNLDIRNIDYIDLEIESAVHIGNMSDEYCFPAVKVAAKCVTLIDETPVKHIVVRAVFKRPARSQVQGGGKAEFADTPGIFKAMPVVMRDYHSDGHPGPGCA